jgi:phage terminase large subunit-like protein
MGSKRLLQPNNKENYIIQYWKKIKSGEILVCKKIKKQYSKLIDDIKKPKGNWIYDDAKAKHAIDFIEKYCKHSKGKWGGKPLLLELWQKALLSAAFGFVDKVTGLRKYTRVILIVARKNGKSTLAAAVGLYLQIGDGEPGAEVYSVATKKDQAKIIWQEAKRMVHKSPALRKRIKTLIGEIVGLGKYQDTFFKPLGSDSDTLDGLNVHGALMDEIHAWKIMNLFDVIVDGMTAREQPMLFATTTAGTVRELVFDELYDYGEKIINELDGFADEHFLPIFYELDSREEWTNPDNAIKANPGLGTIKNQKTLFEKIARAKLQPNAVSNLLTKDFNIRDTRSNAWLTFDEINNTSTFTMEDIKNSYAISGTDLSATTDLTCATLLLMKPDSDIKYVLQMYFLPEQLLEKRSQLDKIPYDKWEQARLLKTCEGFHVSFEDVTAWYVEMYEKYQLAPYWNYYDRALAGYWVGDMTNHGFNMTPCAQGAMTFSQPMKLMEGDLKGKLINYNNNPILKWCLTNTALKVDDNGNIRPIKGISRIKRVDGTFSLLNAYVGLYEHLEDYKALIRR